MEKITTLLIPALLGILLFRALLLPMKLGAKAALHSGCGLLCLWILNSVSGFTGVYLPINAVTAAISGFLGIPGIGLIAALEMLG